MDTVALSARNEILSTERKKNGVACYHRDRHVLPHAVQKLMLAAQFNA